MDKVKLVQKIEESGLKRTFIAKELRVSDRALRDKINGATEFKNSEIIIMTSLLGLSEDEMLSVFFPKR